MHTGRQCSHCRGFSNLELMVVMAIIILLAGMTSLTVIRMIRDAKEKSALSQISAIMRAARQAALAKREERRVVLKVTYPGDATTLKQVFEGQPIFEFWVERKRRRNVSWDVPENVSPPLDDVQSLATGLVLVDVNGRSIVPAEPSKGEPNEDNTRSFKSYLIFSSQGVVTYFYRQDDGGIAQAQPLTTNLALHFMFGGATVDLRDADPSHESIDYLEFVSDREMVQFPAQELLSLVSSPPSKTEFLSRTQAQTLYIIRLTGQSAAYDYGIYPPWPRSTLPEEAFEGAT